MKFENLEKNINITADKIEIGESVSFGKNINVKLKGTFKIGNYSRLGNDTEILGNNVSIGSHLFNSSGLRIGGGGRQHPDANFSIGDRCTIHNNFINVCEPITIGNDVGLSPDVSILTHGYWLSVLEGYPAKFAGVNIGNGVIVGYRSLIMMGVNIIDNCVIGANALVAKSIDKKGIYGGNPAKYIKDITIPTFEEKIELVNTMLEHYSKISVYHNINPNIKFEYPYITINDFIINVETLEYDGIEDIETDDFRDFIRKYGIRIYTNRPFVSNFNF